MKHLWEIDHPYYCNEGNYFDNNCGDSYKKWQDFLAEYADADFDMNLAFRFDWFEEEGSYTGDDNYRNGTLKVFWMGQRKGLYLYSTVEVCRADEAAVIEFLRPRWEHMRLLWEPISNALAQADAACGVSPEAMGSASLVEQGEKR